MIARFEGTDGSGQKGHKARKCWSSPILGPSVAPDLATVAAAPAFAASPCAPQTISFGGYANGTTFPSGSTFTAGAVTATLSLTGATTANANSAIFATTPTTKELRFYDLNASNTSQTIKFTFNRPVTNLAIQIVDIDQGNGTITGSPHIGIRRMSFTPSSC